jgi:hypothetical protein
MKAIANICFGFVLGLTYAHEGARGLAILVAVYVGIFVVFTGLALALHARQERKLNLR